MRRVLLLLLVLLLSAYPVSAEDNVPIVESATGDDYADGELASYGIRVVAWRNDSIDADDDGRDDAVRIVLALNKTAEVESADVNILVTSYHDGRSVEEWNNLSFSGAIETSIRIDAWGEGIYVHKLQMFEPQSGKKLADLDAGEWNMAPALTGAYLELKLSAPEWMETGDECTIERTFIDEIGERYDVMGKRDIRGIPFKVNDWDDVLDCSLWPAGDYLISETYQNGLGQKTESWLNLTINNRPAPSFELQVIGDGEEYGTTCLLHINPTTIDSHEEWTYIWDTIPDHGAGDSPDLNCSSWQPGVHLVRIEVVNEQGISSTSGLNLVRLTPLNPVDSNISENQSMAWPVRSGGDAVGASSDTGLYGAGSAALLVFLVCIMIGMRSKEYEEEEVIGVPRAAEQKLYDAPPILTPAQAFQQQWGQPDDTLPEPAPSIDELPTTVDADGITWRKHPDGKMDWYDEGAATWVAFE